MQTGSIDTLPTILTLTMNPALDVFLESPALEPGRKLRCAKPLYIPGGGGINVSRAIRRLGGQSMALFPAGGTAGYRVIELLAREQIATNVIRIAEETRENVNVLETTTGREYRFIVPGPKLAFEEWKHVLRAIHSLEPRPDYLVASGSLPPNVPSNFHARLAELCTTLKIRFVVDTTGEALRSACGKGTYLLKCNVAELTSFAGGDESEDGVLYTAQSLVDAGRCEVIVVSAGAAGAVVAQRAGAMRIPAPVVPVTSAVGAGDSMTAGIVFALANGSSIEDAAMFGVAAGSAAVMTHRHELCRREETEHLYAELHRSISAAPVAVGAA